MTDIDTVVPTEYVPDLACHLVALVSPHQTQTVRPGDDLVLDLAYHSLALDVQPFSGRYRRTWNPGT